METAKILILIVPVLFASAPAGAADEPRPSLEELEKRWEEATSEYMHALLDRRDALEKEIDVTLPTLIDSDDKHQRKEISDKIAGLYRERADLNDKIRQINAGSVVKFSNTKNKIVKMITGQSG